jgi:VIT1/CCC1 family predicted Fe2+/Mn2+ transporter
VRWEGGVALSLVEIRRQIILVLYDYMLSSDEDSYWFSVASIREGMSENVSGALTKIAIDALVAEKFAEEGHDGDYKPVYALSAKGIGLAEQTLSKAGISVSEYAPAPSADQILSQIADKETAEAISKAVADVRTKFVQSNEAGALDEMDQEIISDELAVGADIASKPIYRLRTLKSVLVPALRFIVEKFSGTSLEEAAKHLIKLLLGS